ncbi:AAA family ATPase [Corynebacterium sp. ES2794-CONJ1]|uniref:HelD family protein n=1 Tax=unclassified Corynebacterium TaxID=2624378 RepID=UPI002166EEA5|nr:MULTISPECIES: AAA family ATPase [unclassified Corynebacterium]MCS4490745.1 AAA family ATPase [Corynebacterium sp. ES2775-CONJ]MCS4492547.1 AAA family ATPase [Corynebacterium sp. ES2715-CONJ3]MCS4532648.1 AAA family ATPase [Corynebacterium sp. ES2730-CONJ]MCU9520043.1 AAA family ATPase [Corynebacterium sp. ES2794-CONJ1]
MLFTKLDAEVEQARRKLSAVQMRVDHSDPDAGDLLERDTEFHALNQRIDRLNLASLGLVFGRIDIASSGLVENPVPGRDNLERRYIGRMGLDDRNDDYRTLLLDWRAPMARPFYLATTAQPGGVEIRRHIRTKGRTVVRVDDEILGGDLSGIEYAPHSVAHESALHLALQQARGSHMHSIVETIQSEQDTIIRDKTRGVMVVEGGPGTGKTAVALHRIAYLLYTWREQLDRQGVLIIGPNPTFLEYISRVLPELGETGVVLSTIGELYPQMVPSKPESLAGKEVKGSLEMITILKRAVARHQSELQENRIIRIEGIDITLTPAMVKSARTRARRGRRPHNLAQPLFADALSAQLTKALVSIVGADPLGRQNLLSQGDQAQIHDDILASPELHELVAEFWPILRPQDVLAEMLCDAKILSEILFDYDEDTFDALLRDDVEGFSASDAALLDELAQLIGPHPAATREQKWDLEREAAESTLEGLSSSANSDLDDESDAEILSAFDIIDAEELADWQVEKDIRTTADRARNDREWTYGHVIIDEAQELSPMEWRMVMRRIPARWMTVVGDTAQTGSPAGVDSWAETLAPFVSQRFTKHELTVNYRTPLEIMEYAHKILARIGHDRRPATSLRSSGYPVRFYPSDTDPMCIARELKEKDPHRSVAIIAADHRENSAIRGVSSIKGLEFDHIVVVEPNEIVESSPQGYQDLYVALTRATQSLTIIGDSTDLT